MQINHEFMTALIASNATDEEIRGFTVALSKLLFDTRDPFWLLISGHDDDPRELWEIPEVADLCRRFVTLGFISVLAVQEESDDPKMALTALKVWLLARGELRAGTQNVTTETFKQFWGDLMESNRTAEALLASHKPEDAQHIYALRINPPEKS